MKLKYTGPFLRVTAEGFSFVRNIATEVADEDVAARLLGAKTSDGVNLFVDEESAVEV